MAWIAVDEDGDEFIYRSEPYRSQNYWHMCDNYFVELPKGSVEKLLGRKLYWKDEPVELKE